MNEPTRPVLRLAGALIALGALGFTLVFIWLATSFGYPDVLDRPAAEVLPALLAGGARLRLVWVAYALLPVMLSAAAVLLHRVGVTRTWGTAAGISAGVAMTVGLARWSTLQWSLAESFASGQQVSQTFDTLNLVLGNVIGEFLGEVLLAGWLIAIARALPGRWLKGTTLLLATLMLIGSLRNLTPIVQPATEVTNTLLPLVLLWLGLGFALRRREPVLPLERRLDLPVPH